MKSVWKIEIDYRSTSGNLIHIPKYSKFLSCDFQGEQLVLWFLFDVIWEKVTETRSLLIIRTGDQFQGDGLEYIGTAYDRDVTHPFIIHLFEQII